MKEQRWGCVPPEPLPLRTAAHVWQSGEADLVRRYLFRQDSPAVRRWVTDRKTAYEATLGQSGECPDARLWDEATLDLAVWQLQRDAGAARVLLNAIEDGIVADWHSPRSRRLEKSK